MRKFFTIFRHFMNVVFFTAATVVLGLYVVMHYNLAGKLVDTDLQMKIMEKLHTRIEVGEIEVNWLNQIAFNRIILFDQQGDTLLTARRAMVALEVVPLLERKVVINTIQIIDFQLNVRKDSLKAQPNYAFLIEALMPKQADQQRRFINDASLHAVLLRQGRITYDVLDQPEKQIPHLADPNHLDFSEISAGLSLEISHISGLNMHLKRMKLKEKCGISLRELSGYAALTADTIKFSQCAISLTQTDHDGLNNRMEAQGDILMQRDSMLLRLDRLDLLADNLGEIHARLALSAPLDSLLCTQYETAFYSSRLNIAPAEGFLVEYGVDIPSNLRPWIQQIEAIRWSGSLDGQGSQVGTFRATLSTEGELCSHTDLSGRFHDNLTDSLTVTFDSDIERILIDRHCYQEAHIKGSYSNRNFKSEFSCSDPLCHLDGHTEVAFAKHETHVTGVASIQRICPSELHLTHIDNLKGLSFNSKVSVDVSILNHAPRHQHKSTLITPPFLPEASLITGQLTLDSTVIHSTDDTLHLGSLHLNMQREQQTQVLTLLSPIANIVGTPTSIIGYIPSNPHLTQMLRIPGTLGQDMTLQAEWDSVKHTLTLKADIPQWDNGESSFSILLSSHGSTEVHSPMPLMMDTRLSGALCTEKHTLATDLNFKFCKAPFDIRFKPSLLTLDGKDFRISSAHIYRPQGAEYLLEDFSITEEERELNLSGSLSQDNHLELSADLNHWQLDFFLDMLHKGYLDFGGYASGKLAISSHPYPHLRTEEMRVDSFSYINTHLGQGLISGIYDLDRDHLQIKADLQTDPKHRSHAECDVRMHAIHDTIDLRVQTDSLPIDFVSYWIGGAIQDLHGHGSGNVRLYGDCNALNLVGRPKLHNVTFTNDFLGTRFSISDTLNMETDATGRNGFVGLNNVTLYDRDGRPAVLTLDLYHHNLHNMEYGLDIDIPESNQGFLIYDHPTQKAGDYYWGRLWMTGRCQMHGTYSHHRISVQMAPAGRSTFFLSPGEENYAENVYSFLTFRDKQQLQYDRDNDLQRRSQTFAEMKSDDDPIYLEADLLIHANNRCLVNVQLDPLAEDRLICRGEGDLALHYDPYHDINLTGGYDITSGSYTVNLKGDLMTKSFQLQPSSRITFPGSPSETELNLKATYNIPSANLRDLDESFATMASLSRTTLPVDCKLNVTGPITQPQIAFDLEVKNTSDDVQVLVHNIIGTQEMLNREVFYLLLFSKFYTPEYASTAQRQTGSELSSFASSSLTSQLNNLLGHMSDNFTLGTNFRSDKGDFTDMEMDLSISTRLLNDRLLMTGNLGYRDPSSSINQTNQTNSFIGDFDMEFLINTRGTIRAKAYSHSNERDYSINNALTTQGIGLILRKDFKSFSELLKRKEKVTK